MVATLTPGCLKINSPLEKQVFEVFTPFAFNKFQEEFTRVTTYSIIHVEGNEFSLKYFQGDTARLHKVFWDGSVSSCSCKNFEFWGILCRHILRVYMHSDCFEIPRFYLPLRWYCDALQTTSCAQEVEDDLPAEEERILPNHVSEGGDNNVLCPPQSKTKGRPKKKREKSGKELAKKHTKTCSICKKPGHTKPTCPDHLSLNSTGDCVTSTSQKKQKKTATDLGLNPVFTLKN